MNGTSIGFSGDGRLIAATYYHAPSDELATVVIAAEDGAVVAHHERRVTLGCPNGTWIGSNRLVLFDDLSDEPVPLYSWTSP